MNKVIGALASVLPAAGIGSSAVRADNLLGLYAGLGAGESTVRSDGEFANGYGSSHDDADHHAAWKASVGIRPISPLGAEFEYIDFGSRRHDPYDNYGDYGPDSHPRALALFGVGHLPLPIPSIDIYGKAGVARLHTDVYEYDGPNCSADQECPLYVPKVTEKSCWDTKFAYGAGVQSRFWAGLAVRAEYQRISSQHGDPDLFSVRATWTF